MVLIKQSSHYCRKHHKLLLTSSILKNNLECPFYLILLFCYYGSSDGKYICMYNILMSEIFFKYQLTYTFLIVKLTRVLSRKINKIEKAKEKKIECFRKSLIRMCN